MILYIGWPLFGGGGDAIIMMITKLLCLIKTYCWRKYDEEKNNASRFLIIHYQETSKWNMIVSDNPDIVNNVDIDVRAAWPDAGE